MCAKTKKSKNDTVPPVTPPQANTPLPLDRRPMVIEREDRDSTRTKAGNRNQKSSKEPDSTVGGRIENRRLSDRFSYI
uniref:Uncharacterized protein n=1 Tax=Caenorhabditis tropicalis TaxID=1561998 RepID=A0A1I7UEJ8_9PELO